jgi:iron complex outermembrane receptor protein
MSFGSIRGASSFGLSYPKIYIDGIEVANPLLVSRFNADAIDRVEVIRGPQGSALYGTDAISGVVNIVTRHEGVDVSGERMALRASAGITSSDFGSHGTLTQEHALSFRSGTATRSAGFDVAGGTTGNFVPNGHSEQLTASANSRIIGALGSLVGTARFFAQRAGSPSNPLIAPSRPPLNDTMYRAFSRRDSAPQSVREYTLGATGTLVRGDRWTHSLVAGVDGYRLSNVASNETPLVQDADSALRAAEGGADRATIRLSSVARFGEPETRGATITFAAENATLRESTRGDVLLQPAGGPGGLHGPPPRLVTWQNTLGLTAQASASVDNTLFVTAGTRLERNNALSASHRFAVLPMIGAAVVRDGGPWTMKLRSAYGKGIRPPQTATRATVWQSTQHSSTQQSLGPEEQSGVEAGADLTFNRWLSLQVTRFDQRAAGLIQQVAMATNEGPMKPGRLWYSLQNVGEITNRGWEVQAAAQLRPVSLAATLTTVNSRVASVAPGYTGDLRAGDRMLGIPSRTASLTAIVDRYGWSASFGASRAWDWINYDRLELAQSFISSYTMQTHSVNDLVGPPLRTFWRRYDGSTRIRATGARELRPGLSVEITGDNLLGYQRGEPDNVTVVPGRTVLTGIRVRF